jgi:hypothetical protein
MLVAPPRGENYSVTALHRRACGAGKYFISMADWNAIVCLFTFYARSVIIRVDHVAKKTESRQNRL